MQLAFHLLISNLILNIFYIF